MADAFVIETAELRKTYDGVEALRGLNLQVPAGSICGFLGRNGAGKTTTIKVLLGMARPTSGQARVFGLPADATGAERRDPPAHRLRQRRQGSLRLHDRRRDRSASPPRSIRAGAPISSSATCARSSCRPSRKVKALSRGMRTKLALLLALCRGADLLILDEPTSGLDPAVTEEVLQALVAHVGARGDDACSSRRIRSPKSIRSPTASRSSIAARSRLPARSTICARAYRRIQLVFDGDAPEPAFRAPGVVRVRRKGRVLTRAVERRRRAASSTKRARSTRCRSTSSPSR